MTREEALEAIKAKMDYYESDKRLRGAIETLIPELAESEDGRIRKEIIEFIQWSEDRGMTRHDFHQAKRPSEWIAYLEKQKEQKSLNISAASEWLREHVCHYMNSEYNEFHKCVEYDGSIDKERLINDFEEAMQKEQKSGWNNPKINGEPISTGTKAVDIPCTEWGEENKEDAKDLCYLVVAELGKYRGDDYWKSPWALDSTGTSYPLYFAKLGAKWQREQKSAEWSDDKFPKDIEADAVQFCFDNGINITPYQAKQIATHYLMVGHNEGYVEGRKNAHIPAKELGLPSSLDFKQEWSEKEIEHLYTLASYIKSSGYEDDGEFLEGVADKLTSLRPSWKPSEEQMEALKECGECKRCIKKLYEDFQKRYGTC